MKKKIILLLFIIPLLVIPFIKVEAVDLSKVKHRYITKVENTNVKVNVDNIARPHRGSFFLIELDNQVALCLDPGVPIHKNDEYKLVQVYDTNIRKYQLLAKAYMYAVNNKNDRIARASAQIVAWNVDGWGDDWQQADINSDYDRLVQTYQNTRLLNSFIQGLKNFNLSNSTILSVSIKHLHNILSTELPDGVDFGKWQYVDESRNKRQHVISYAILEEDNTQQPQETCKIKITNRLTGCYGSYATFGYVYEYTDGDCLPGYNKKKNNVYSKLGKKEVDVGTYCRMYCSKYFYETLPGNIGTAVNVGRYIVWPNNNINNNRYKVNANLSEYPMALAIEKDCYLSADAEKLGQDYTTVLANYNNYIRSISSIYNTYKNSGRTCSWFQNDYNQKNSAATNYCATVGPDPGCHDEPYTCCSGPAPKDKKGNVIGPCPTTTCHNCVDNPGRAEWRARNAECNRLRGIANEALSKLNSCNNIQNYVNAVVNVVNDFNNCVSYNASFNLNFSAPGASASYNDDEYGTTMQLKESKTVKTCEGCTSGIGRIYVDKNNVETNLISNGTLTNKVKAIASREIIGTTLKYYDLVDGLYYYVNKDNNKSVNSNAGLKNYSVIGFSNMPISYKANPKKTYDLRINIPTLTGMASDFSALSSSNNYVCHYKITKTTSSTCVCPEGTKHAGESLDCLSKNNEGTCVELQEQYCNSDQEIPHNCTESDLTCPNDPTMNLTSCVNAGKSYNWCVNNFCSGKKWVCPAGTNEGMDLSACVIPKIIEGSSEREAYEYCRDVTCPYKGIKIIYRVIDLTNPFPSKDADSVVAQRDLRVGMFNDELKGRYPGSNWNSTTVVKNRILNNRNVDGDKVYNKKPLYEFTLNSSNIKAIRNYNRSQKDSYADFKLNCLNDRTACVSSFIRSSAAGITGGTCRNVTVNSFYTCNN